MKVGIKLFDKKGQVVLERDEAPKQMGGASMVTYKGTHYIYCGLFGPANPERPYAKFQECNPPLALDELLG